MNSFWLNNIPLSGVFLLTFLLVFFSIWIGTALGNRRRRKPGHEAESPLSTVSGALLGLLAFLLGFTFAIVTEVFQNRRLLLLNEVNAIGTTYLRTEFLSEPHKSEIQKLLREYVDIRVDLAKQQLPEKKLDEALTRAESLQDQMWSHTVDIAKAGDNSVIDALFINSLNEMIDLQTSRVTVFRYRLPPVIWYALYFITIISMLTVGYQSGLLGKSSLKIGIVLALTFSTVILLICDLDRPTEGHFRISQKPMLELQKNMQVPDQKAGKSLILQNGEKSANLPLPGRGLGVDDFVEEWNDA